jgi:hypothetical protein
MRPFDSESLRSLYAMVRPPCIDLCPLAASLILSICVTTTSEATPLDSSSFVRVKNLGLALAVRTGVKASGTKIAFAVDESAQGQDLNGDGDRLDSVLHVYDAATDTLTNVGLAVYPPFPIVFVGDYVSFAVSEAAQGQSDLDGDGRADGTAVHVFDTASGLLVNLQRGTDGQIASDGSILAFSSFESGADLNNDGDTTDSIPFVYDLATSTLTHIPLAATVSGVSNGYVVLSVSEAQEGATDLDGDGDINDDIIAVYDSVTHTTHITGRAGRLKGFFSSSPTAVLSVSELSESVDLNGDGDAQEDVLFVLDLPTATPTNLAIATGPVVSIMGDTAAFVVDEGEQGQTDLNGDLDTSDRCAAIYDQQTQTVTICGFAIRGSAIAISDGLVAFGAVESDQGATDLNNDGDIDDEILVVVDRQQGTIQTGISFADPGGIGSDVPSGFGHRIFVLTSEAASASDLNGDGDLTDDAVLAYDVLTNRATTFGVSARGFSSSIRAETGLAVFLVSETDEGGRDLNGDGDSSDLVLFARDLGVDVNINLHLATSGVLASNQSLVAFLVPEADQGGHDLNRDGDATDQILHVLLRTPFSAAAEGTVASGYGTAARVLEANGRATLVQSSETPVSLTLASAPVGPAATRYLVWVWRDSAPISASLRIAGVYVGATVDPSPFARPEIPQPVRCIASPGLVHACGAVTFETSPGRAPWMLSFSRRPRLSGTYLLQGLIQDAASVHPRQVSITNSVIWIVP